MTASSALMPFCLVDSETTFEMDLASAAIRHLQPTVVEAFIKLTAMEIVFIDIVTKFGVIGVLLQSQTAVHVIDASTLEFSDTITTAYSTPLLLCQGIRS
jgi:hypothetical protein